MQTLFLSADVTISNTQAGNIAVRTFKGVANSGKPFIYQGQRAIVDLDSLNHSAKVPALLLHDRDKRVGFGELSVVNHELIITGTLLDNDDARAIAAEADLGFPWQMSAHVVPSATDELTGEQTAIVNGQTVTAPILILRHCTIPEVSFTPTGVDNQTMAMILSNAPNFTPQKPTGDNPMTLEQALAKIAELENTLKAKDGALAEKDKQIKDLQDEKAKLETESKAVQVDAQLSQAGFTKNEKGEWQGISAGLLNYLLSTDVDEIKGVINDIRPKGGVPEFLLSEQHTTNTGVAGATAENPLLANAKARK